VDFSDCLGRIVSKQDAFKAGVEGQGDASGMAIDQVATPITCSLTLAWQQIGWGGVLVGGVVGDWK